ncbi:MAG: hypothetical protein B7X54_05955 [Idiomarina sp. 34-48-12]|nr:MAG: hypothetical protein B7X54_05955 [Idiomarina sp. 34-48-12]
MTDDNFDVDDLFGEEGNETSNVTGNKELPLAIPTSSMGVEFAKNLTYSKVVANGKAAAQKNDGFKLGSIDDLIILSAILSSYDLLQAIASRLQRTAESMIFPDYVYRLRDQFEQVIPLRTFQINEQTTNWFREANKLTDQIGTYWERFWSFEGVEIEFEPAADSVFVDTLLELFKTRDEKNLLREFIDLNPPLKLTDLRRRRDGIEDYLMRRVKGQPAAIRAVVESEMTAMSRSTSKLRDIFTFAGPSGVGKTELAKAYAEALSKAIGSGYVLRVFNMEQYSDNRAHMHLFGAGSAYTDSSMGELTKHAECFPRTVYLFDEIEKASVEVVQALLTLLDTGHVCDNTTLEEASLSQSIVIFTTNLGQREFSRAEGMGELDIFDVLMNARKHNSDGPALTPELVNRLRAGTAVRFHPLHAQALSAIAASIVKGYRNSSAMINYEFDSSVSNALLYKNLPSPAPRAMSRTLDSFLAQAQNVLLDNYGDQLANIKTIKIRLADSYLQQLEGLSSVTFLAGNSDGNGDGKSEGGELQQQLRTMLPAQPLISMSLKEAERDINRATSTACVVIDAVNQSTADVLEIIADIRGVDGQIGIIVIGNDKQLKNEELEAQTWLQLSPSDFAAQRESLQSLIYAALVLKVAKQKQWGFEYRIVDQQIDAKTIEIVLDNCSFVPRVSSERALNGVPGLMTRRPDTRLDDVIGLPRAKEELQRILMWLKNPQLLRRHNLPMPTGILLLGPPGTGKTLLARAVAGEADLPFISLNIGEMLSSNVNGTSENVQRAFESARDIAPCIMFIDEIDAIAGHREHGDNQSSKAAVNTLLTQLDGLQKNGEPIFVIAATNRADSLDPAVTRSGRLDRPILCDIPNRADREKFVRFYMKKYKLAFSEEDISEFATLTIGLSGADMEQVFISALYNLANPQTEHISITPELIRDTISHIRFGAPNTENQLSEDSKKQTATHEAGHLLAQKLLLPEQRIAIATIESRNRALGFIATQREEGSGPQTLEEIKAQLTVFMGGREAEQLLFGSSGKNGGASSDLQQATRLAHYAVCHLGLDVQFGPINYGDSFTEVASEELRQLAATRVRAWLEEAQVSARELMRANQKKLEFIADVLFTKESVYEAEINSWW